AEAAWRELLPTGLRLLLFAEARRAAAWEGEAPAEPEGQARQEPRPPNRDRPLDGSLTGLALRPLALVALSDQLRPEAGAVLDGLAAQGIRFKVLSGDNPETVRATIAHLRLPLGHEPVVTGEQLEADPKLVREAGVFGRVAPKQKLEIVTALQAAGFHV